MHINFNVAQIFVCFSVLHIPMTHLPTLTAAYILSPQLYTAKSINYESFIMKLLPSKFKCILRPSCILQSPVCCNVKRSGNV